ncbi:MAG: hypothetical protein JO101_03245 [Candidatus Eremiobacteraeota bacterium]|nr:hypothetical protein [Candidatus Eremiobacteraeota bacterium]MBV8354309.1 hypothetical protein [Candidatus Eremiobacteraeota bacterium]
MSAQPLEIAFGQVADRLNGLDRRLDLFEQRLDSRFNLLESRFEQRFNLIESRFEQRFNWLIGVIIGTWITTILTVLFHH